MFGEVVQGVYAGFVGGYFMFAAAVVVDTILFWRRGKTHA